jgi:hypothetical protein
MTIRSTVTIAGTVEGTLWMPGVTAQMDIHATMRRMDGETLADMVGDAIAPTAGNFQDAPKLTADSTITVTRTRTGRTATIRERTYSVDTFASIAEYVDMDAWTFGE